LVQCLEQLAPLRFAAEWDNVGLLVGARSAAISQVLLCIDLTPAVYQEARTLGAQAIVAYHPPIFKPISKVLEGSIAFDAVRDQIAIYSPHTALDAADGGTNDVLADAVGIVSDARRVGLKAPPAVETHCKVVTFVPVTHVDVVADALFEAGAGQIGSYSRCSFRTVGEGTFLGSPEHSHPTVGVAGKFESVSEIRLESVVALSLLSTVIAALHRAHPYETPAVDVLRLHGEPPHQGYGRMGPLAMPKPLTEVLEQLKVALGVTHLMVAGPTDRIVHRAGVGAGATGELLTDALRAKLDLFVLGELRHHDALRAAKANMTVVMTLHSNSERATLQRLKQRLAASLEGVDFCLSTLDRDPFVVL
jgi:dinuclear metal center YbgI/SA1388 family protein